MTYNSIVRRASSNIRRESLLITVSALALAAMGQAAFAQQITVGGDVFSNNALVTDPNPASEWDAKTNFIIGNTSTGTLTVEGGGSVKHTEMAVIGNEAGSFGTVTVTGPDSKWSEEGSSYSIGLMVGLDGRGGLLIEAGGVVELAGRAAIGQQMGSNGAIIVSGPGSSLLANGSALNTHFGLTVGEFGSGNLIIEKGGTVKSMGSSQIGTDGGGIGTVRVSGPGSSWETTDGAMAVGSGRGGVGTLIIEDGASVSVEYFSAIGFSSLSLLPISTGVVEVKGSKSVWKMGTGLDIAVGGTARLTITDGGFVDNAGETYVGGRGTVTVDGSGSGLSTGTDMKLGGSLDITNGGLVSVGASSEIGMTASEAGIASVSGAGSKWTTGTVLTVGENGSGTLNISNGGVVTSQSSAIAGQSGSTGTVNVSGEGAQWNTESVLTVGDAGTGTLNISNGGVVNSQSTILAITNASSINIGEGGTFNTDLLTFSDGAGTLNFDTKADYAFATDMEGAGNVNIQSGHVDLIGDSGNFSGRTQVFDKSVLSVNGVLGGTLDVLGGGVLGGIGTVGSTTIEDLAALAPGNSIGTIHVKGDLTFNSGSTYRVETSAGGTGDKTEISGVAKLNGAHVQVEADSGNWQPTTTYTILTASGGVAGHFSGVETNRYFLKPEIGYPDANTVILFLKQDELPIDGNSELVENLQKLDKEKGPRTVAQVQGGIHPSLSGVLLDDSRFINEAVNNRVRSAFGVSSAPLPVLAFGPDGADLQAATTDRFALWAQGFGSWEDKKSDEAFAGLDRSIGGIFAGGDAAIGDHARLGLVGGYSHTKLDEPDLAASASVESYYLGVYGGAQLGAFNLRSGSSYTWHDIGIDRQVQFTNTREYLAADYHAATAQAFAEAGYNIKTAKVDFEPFAGLAYANLRSGGFSETGGTAALSGAVSNNDVTYTTLGLHASTELSFGFADTRLRGTAAWRHAYGDITPVSTSASAGANIFDISGLPIARDAALLAAGFDMDIAQNTTIGLSYQGQIASRVQDHGLRANLNVRF